MASHNILGKYGEQLGSNYLAARRFRILHMNWKYSYYEIDIIASCGNVLHFIEVKTRRSHRFGLPEESVDRRKFRRLMKAAEAYLYQHPAWKHIQYDILAITLPAEGPPEFFFMEDVYL